MRACVCALMSRRMYVCKGIKAEKDNALGRNEVEGVGKSVLNYLCLQPLSSKNEIM